MSFGDIEVRVNVKADIAELRAAIAAFKEGKISADDLATTTERVKGHIQGQSQALTVLNRATRVQNFELLTIARTIRSVTSLFSSLNQVYQTLLLRQIATNQVSFEQQRQFDRLSTGGHVLIDMLNVLGPANADVIEGFDRFLGAVDSLNSKQLKQLIGNLEAQATQAGLSAEEQGFLNEKISQLKKLLEETELKEKNKDFEDFFGILTAGGTAAGAIGTFAVNLIKLGGGIRFLQAAAASSPYALAILALLFGKEFVQTAGEGGLEEAFKEHPLPLNPFDMPKGSAGLGPPQNIETNVIIENATIRSDLDIEALADRIAERVSKRFR